MKARLKKARELIEKLRFGCPFREGTIGEKDAEALERTADEAANVLEKYVDREEELADSENLNAEDTTALVDILWQRSRDVVARQYHMPTVWLNNDLPAIRVEFFRQIKSLEQ